MLNKANGRKATRFSSIFVCMFFFLFGFGGWITTIPIFAMIIFFFLVLSSSGFRMGVHGIFYSFNAKTSNAYRHKQLFGHLLGL